MYYPTLGLRVIKKKTETLDIRISQTILAYNSTEHSTEDFEKGAC